MRCHSAMFGGAGYLLTFLEPVRRGRTRAPFAASILRLCGAACHMMCRCCRKLGNGSDGRQSFLVHHACAGRSRRTVLMIVLPGVWVSVVGEMECCLVPWVGWGGGGLHGGGGRCCRLYCDVTASALWSSRACALLGVDERCFQ